MVISVMKLDYVQMDMVLFNLSCCCPSSPHPHSIIRKDLTVKIPAMEVILLL